MTYVDDPQRDEYTATSGQTVFAYTYRILDQAHLKVYNEGVLQTLTTHYTVSGVGDHGGGNVTFVSGVTLSNTVIILRDTTNDQNVDYTVGGAFPAESNEQALDKLTMECQDLGEEVGRSIKLPVTSTLEDVDIPDGSSNASMYFRWNTGGTALEAVSATTIVGQGGSITTDIYRYIADPDQTDQGVSSTNSIKAHVDAIAGVEESILLVPGTYTFSTAETIPSNITLVIQKGAVIAPASGITLTVYSPGNIVAADTQSIISGTATTPITFTVGGIIQANWFGAIADDTNTDGTGTDNASAISKALLSIPTVNGSVLNFPECATYDFASTLTLPQNRTVTIHGQGGGTDLGSEIDDGTILLYTGSGIAGATLTGSIDPINSTNVTGQNTLFETELAIGDNIKVNDERRLVTAIADNTHLTIKTNCTGIHYGIIHIVRFKNTLNKISIATRIHKHTFTCAKCSIRRCAVVGNIHSG